MVSCHVPDASSVLFSPISATETKAYLEWVNPDILTSPSITTGLCSLLEPLRDLFGADLLGQQHRQAQHSFNSSTQTLKSSLRNRRINNAGIKRLWTNFTTLKITIVEKWVVIVCLKQLNSCKQEIWNLCSHFQRVFMQQKHFFSPQVSVTWSQLP